MRNFKEIVKLGATRMVGEEKPVLGLMGHESDDFNGVFSVGKLSVIATTETTEKEMVECVSISKSRSNKKPETEKIELVKKLFWPKEEWGIVSGSTHHLM